ncbi:MAG: hypothetical protein U1E62_23965 [Alsobacter sp.]
MSQETMRTERFLIVARVTKRQLDTFPAKGWVAVEVFNEEIVARERFHALRAPLDDMKVGAVLVRALTTPACEKIAFEKTVISKDADFWELQGTAEILRANAAQQEEWNSRVEQVIGELERKRRVASEAAASALAARPARRKASGPPRLALAASGGLAAVLAVGLVVALQQAPDTALDPAVARAREGTTTLIIPDAGDPRILVEYALRPDGTRTVVRRMPREKMDAMAQLDEGGTGMARQQPKNLVDAISGFFAFRQ